MRLLHVITDFQLGGAQRQLSLLAPELSRMGHEVHVAHLGEGPLFSPLTSGAVTMHKISARNNYDPRILGQLIRLLARLRPDVTQTWVPQLDVLGGIACRVTRTPWILREPCSKLSWPNSFKCTSRVWVAKGVTEIVSNSRAGDEYWESKGIRRGHIVIPNALLLDEIEKTEPADMREFGLENGQPFLLYAGRMEDGQKNVYRMVEALMRVVDEKPVVALLCGEGPDRPALQQLLRERGYEKKILPIGYSDKVWALMKRAEAFVFFSLFEGNPNAVLEAMACGCPLVVSDIPEHREFLDEGCTLLADPHDPDAMARAILASLSDPCAARKRAERAREKARERSLSVMAGAYEDVYRQVVSGEKN